MSTSSPRDPEPDPPLTDGAVADDTLAASAALAGELGRRTGVCWLRYDGATRPAWHLWHDDALHVLAGGPGGEEQPLPGLAEADRVEVTQRSKDTGGRLLTWVARPRAVTPADPGWGPLTAALAADRLNLADLAAAPARWARTAAVVRLEPTGEVLERPGALDDQAHLAEPPPSPALTRGRLPRVLHRRVRRRPRLS